MPKLLHEYWEDEDGGWFSAVGELSDSSRETTSPGLSHVFSVWASSWHEAMQLYHDRRDFGEYHPAEGVPNNFYTAEEAAEQDAYLRGRKVR